jgi:hypothetical protein
MLHEHTDLQLELEQRSHGLATVRLWSGLP